MGIQLFLFPSCIHLAISILVFKTRSMYLGYLNEELQAGHSDIRLAMLGRLVKNRQACLWRPFFRKFIFFQAHTPSSNAQICMKMSIYS
jgi:hypothetical protein